MDHPQYNEALVLTYDIQSSLESVVEVFSQYISSYIHVLNKLISHLRRVGALKYERTNLIKFVKKLRYFNDTLQTQKSQLFHDTIVGSPLGDSVTPICAEFSKILEVMDLLNFIFTQSLQKEIIAKTLNFDLTISEECINAIETSYNLFVKYAQWMAESIDANTPLTQLEVVSFALRCAEEDRDENDDSNETDNIFVQEIIRVQDVTEYLEVTNDWNSLLQSRLKMLESHFDDEANKWQDKFAKKK